MVDTQFVGYSFGVVYVLRTAYCTQTAPNVTQYTLGLGLGAYCVLRIAYYGLHLIVRSVAP